MPVVGLEMERLDEIGEALDGVQKDECPIENERVVVILKTVA